MEQNPRQRTECERPSASFLTGLVALVFLVIGYETALFVHEAATLRMAAGHDAPDTVYVVDGAVAKQVLHAEGARIESPLPEDLPAGTMRRESPVYVRHPAKQTSGMAVSGQHRRAESFRFDPNTVSGEELQRLGFSQRQAAAILRYREAGGRFRRKEDFARSYVVDDSVFERLAPFIDIPRLDINAADSAAFETLPGIGKYFASRMVAYRKRLGGYSYPEQLLELNNFGLDRFDGLRDLIRCSPPEPFPLWTLPEEQLSLHPYIGKQAAHGICLYREHNPREQWTLEGLLCAGVLGEDAVRKLSRCSLANP